MITSSSLNTDEAFNIPSSVVYLVDSHSFLFKIKYIFSQTKWRIRKLNLFELLRLWNYLCTIIISLAGRQRRLLGD